MAATIFSGNKVRTLKSGLQIGTGATIWALAVNPTVTPTEGNPGDVLFSSVTFSIYGKIDAGITTNWIVFPIAATPLTPGSVVVVDSFGNLFQDPTKFFWDQTNGRLGIGNNTPSTTLHVTGTTRLDSLSTGLLHADASGNLTSSLLVNADVNSSADIAYSKLADLTGANNRLLIQNGTNKVAAHGSILSSDLILKDGSVTFTANQSLGGNKVTSLANGTTSADAVNYAQLQAVESLISGFSWLTSCISRLVTPPGSPLMGDRYLIDAVLGPATGVWAGHEDEIAEYNGSSWDFTVPTLGAYISIEDESDGLYLYGGASWSKKYFEATTASTGLTKVGFDIRIDSSAAGTGLGFSSGVLSINVDDSTIELNADAIRLKALGVTNNEVSNSAAIVRSKLASGTASHVIINDGSGVFSSEAQLAISRGGTNLSSLGTANQMLGVNSAATALEYKTNQVGTSGTDYNIANSVGAVTFNLPIASSVNTGKLSNTDWDIFNNKQNAGNYITDLTGDVTATGPGSVAATINTNAVTDSKLRQSTGLSIIGRSGNTTGDVADITAASDTHVLRRSGTSIGFGTIVNGAIDAAAAIDRTKLASGTADHVIINNGSGVLASEAQLSIARGGTALGTTPTNGQVLIGNGTNYTLSTITAGAGISITNGSGSITIVNTESSGSSGDISETTFNIVNNQVSLADVTGFLFNSASIRSFVALVSVYVNATTELAEIFEIIGINKPTGGWSITTRNSGNDSQVNFEINSGTGQVQYTSGNYAGFVNGIVKFRARTTSV